LKEFGKNEYDNLVYVNCYKNEVIKTLFNEDKDVNKIILGLSAYSNQTIIAGKTLIFLDEIQEIPHVISTLKYFQEDLPEIHIVAAGSLLGVMNMEGESFPVGKVNIMNLYPMTFDEFLSAMGKSNMIELLKSYDKDLITTFSTDFTEMLRQYYFVGGMPEAVSFFAESKDVVGVRKIQKELLKAYDTDISNHAGRETQRIRMVWNSIPSQLAHENKKFIYGAIRKGARANDFEIAIQWLTDAGLVYKIERVRDIKVPLKFYADANAFKLFVLDVGLLGAMSDTPAGQILIGNNVFAEYKGAFTEDYVLQQLKTLPELPVYYYSKDNSSMEVDFIVQAQNTVLPIEVKAEENVRSKSLRTFITRDFKSYGLKGIRFSMKGFTDQGWMENIPLYAAKEFIVRKCLEDQTWQNR
jgi:predicted AAA+ superfamily ATPase